MMAMIDFPRRGLDGKDYSQKDIEDAFVGNLENEIRDALGKIKLISKSEERVIEFLKEYVGYLLTAKPVTLERLKITTDRLKLFGADDAARTAEFRAEVLNAFNYDAYRVKHLLLHAERLNVKTCCYCNMNYTLLIEEKKARSIEKKALLQFDHFYDKAKYPHLSMSMYNLIPSCATCNQGKPRTGELPIWFNPYYKSIFGLYKFRIKEPLQLYMGMAHPEKIDVECEPQTATDISACDSWFHLSAKYSVHKDIVKEVFDKAQQYPDYANFRNFAFMKEGASYPLRLLLGVYTEEKDYPKRPMSKFISDMWEQACIFHGKV